MSNNDDLIEAINNRFGRMPDGSDTLMMAEELAVGFDEPIENVRKIIVQIAKARKKRVIVD